MKYFPNIKVASCLFKLSLTIALIGTNCDTWTWTFTKDKFLSHNYLVSRKLLSFSLTSRIGIHLTFYQFPFRNLWLNEEIFTLNSNLKWIVSFISAFKSLKRWNVATSSKKFDNFLLKIIPILNYLT